MTPEQLQLLRAARPSGQDEREASIVAARAAAAADSAVTAQLTEERDRDLAMRDALQTVTPPPDLAASLLIAMRAARGIAEPPAGLRQEILRAVQGSTKGAVPTTPLRPDFSRRSWLGWALASAAGLAAGAFYWKRNLAFSLHHLSHQLAKISAAGIKLSLMSGDENAINGWLSYYQAPRSGSLPPKLAALPRKGCHLYQIDRHPVTLECFLLPGMRELHLFSTPAEALQDAPPEDAPPVLQTSEGLTLATWRKGSSAILFLSQEPLASIRDLLS